MTRNVTVDDAAEKLLQSVLVSPKRQRRMLSKTFWGKFGIKRRTRKRIKEVKEALRRRGLILNIGGDAELGTETKNKWIVLSYVEPSPQAVTTQAQHSSANVRTSPDSSTQMMYVQSAVTHISFPRDFDDGQDRIYKLEDWIADLEELRHASLLASREVNWTAPRWIMQRDIMFFYMTKSSKTSIDRLAKESNKKRSAGNWLQHPLGGESRMNPSWRGPRNCPKRTRARSSAAHR